MAIALCFAGNISAIRDPPAGRIEASLTKNIQSENEIKLKSLPSGQAHPEEEELDVGGGQATEHHAH